MQLDPGLIEERFNCEPGEGCTIECFGDSTMGMSGFMFIYTNRDTLSVGGGALLSEFNKTLRTPNDLMEHFKQHPAIKPLLRGAETVEYLAHLIPEGGYRGIPKVHGPGYLVCGDAAMLSNPVHREGSNLAMESGHLAAQTVIHAKEKGDFSERTLAEYRGKLDHSWSMADMRKYDKAVPLLEHNPQLLTKDMQVLDRSLTVPARRRDVEVGQAAADLQDGSQGGCSGSAGWSEIAMGNEVKGLRTEDGIARTATARRPGDGGAGGAGWRQASVQDQGTPGATPTRPRATVVRYLWTGPIRRRRASAASPTWPTITPSC